MSLDFQELLLLRTSRSGCSVKREALAQEFSCEFYKFSQSSFFKIKPVRGFSVYWKNDPDFSRHFAVSKKVMKVSSVGDDGRRWLLSCFLFWENTSSSFNFYNKITLNQFPIFENLNNLSADHSLTSIWYFTIS